MKSPKEIENTLEFKNIKKILMRSYPWILDVTIPEDNYRYEWSFFLNIIIDPYKLKKEKGWTISSLAKYLIKYTTPNEQYAFKSSGPDRIYDGPQDEMESLTTELNNLLGMIRQAYELPNKELISLNKKIKIGSWIIPIMPIPDDEIFS